MEEVEGVEVEEMIEVSEEEETEDIELEEVANDCIGCPEGSPDELPDVECGPCETIDFHSTLVFPAGFSLPVAPDDRADYIAENFDTAIHFDDECFSCEEEVCVVDNADCGPIKTKQLIIQGMLKYLSSLCIASDSAPEAGSQAAVCDTGTICVPEPTVVCVGCQGGCADLRVIGVEVTDVEHVGVSCGRSIWEVTAELEFACQPPVEDNNNA